MKLVMDTDNLEADVKQYDSACIESIRYSLISNYMYKLYLKVYHSDRLNVNKIITINKERGFVPSGITTNFNPDTGLYEIHESLILIMLEFDNEEFVITIDIDCEYDPRFDNYPVIYRMNITRTQGEMISPLELKKYLNSESIKNSPWDNKLLLYSGGESRAFGLQGIKIVEPEVSSLDSMYVPENKMEQFRRFIYAVKNYNEHKINLRYLLNGIPGTGKTQVIRSIINEIKGYATVIMVNAADIIYDELFRFCSYFNPCVLVVDDLDLFIKSREELSVNEYLGKILSLLDGLLKNNIFILASTNDKTLVDKAAIRPGRFDMIIDMNSLLPVNYMDIIRRETNDINILTLFNEETLQILKEKRATGAFIVNLIKQLKSTLYMTGEIRSDDITSYLNYIHRGFYDYNDEEKLKVVGF